jgi:hypothetical protein
VQTAESEHKVAHSKAWLSESYSIHHPEQNKTERNSSPRLASHGRSHPTHQKFATRAEQNVSRTRIAPIHPPIHSSLNRIIRTFLSLSQTSRTAPQLELLCLFVALLLYILIVHQRPLLLTPLTHPSTTENNKTSQV